MKDYDDRQADWAKKQQTEEAAERKSAVKLLEVRAKLTGDIKENDEVKVRIDKADTLKFRSPVALKKGDTIKITVEKVDAVVTGRW